MLAGSSTAAPGQARPNWSTRCSSGARRSATPDAVTPRSDIAPQSTTKPFTPQHPLRHDQHTETVRESWETGQADLDPSVLFRRSASRSPFTLASAQIRVAPTPILGGRFPGPRIDGFLGRVAPTRAGRQHLSFRSKASFWCCINSDSYPQFRLPRSAGF